jgi:hypothetical protein
VRTAAIVAVLVLVGCSSGGAMQTFRWGDPARCTSPECRVVERHIDQLIAARGSFGRTLRTLRRLGDRAIPVLRHELEGDEVARVQVAAYMLERLGHRGEIAAWCRTLASRDLACVDD